MTAPTFYYIKATTPINLFNGALWMEVDNIVRITTTQYESSEVQAALSAHYVIVVDPSDLPVDTTSPTFKVKGGWDPSGNTYPTGVRVGDTFNILMEGTIGGVHLKPGMRVLFTSLSPMVFEILDNGTSVGDPLPLTTLGDLVVGGVDGVPERLAAGANGQVLKIVSNVPAWAAESGGGGATLTPITFDPNQVANGTLSNGDTTFDVTSSQSGAVLGQTTLATPYQFELTLAAIGSSPLLAFGLIHSSYQAADAAGDMGGAFDFASYLQYFSGSWTNTNNSSVTTVTNWVAPAPDDVYTFQYNPATRSYAAMQNGVVASFGSGHNTIPGAYDVKLLLAVNSGGTTTVAGNFAGPFVHGLYPATILNVDTDNDPIVMSDPAVGGNIGTLQSGLNYQLAYGCSFDAYLSLPSVPIQGQWVNVKKIDSSSNTLAIHGNGVSINGNSILTLTNTDNFANLFYDSNLEGWYTISQFIGAPSAATQPVSISKTVGETGDFPNMSSALTWHGNQVWGHGATATYTWQTEHNFTYLDAVMLVGNNFANAKITTVDNPAIVDSSCTSMSQFGIPAFINLFNSVINITGNYQISGVATIAGVVSTASTLGIQGLSDSLSISGTNYHSVFYFTSVETVLTLGDSVGLVSQNSTFDQHLYAQGPITLYSTPNTVMSLMGASNLALIGDCGALSIVPNGYAHSIGLASAKVDILLNTSSPDITPANGYTYLYTGQGSSGSIRTIPTYIMNFQSTATTNLFATSVDGSTLTIRSPLSVSGTIPDYVFGLSSGGYIANIGTTGMVQGTHYNHREYVFSANGSTIDSSIPVPVNVGNALVLDAAWGRTLVDTTTTDSSVIVIPEDVGTYELNVSAATMTFDLVNFTRWNKQRIDILLKQGLTTVSFTVNGTPITPVGSFTKVANSLLKLEYNYILSTFSVSSIPEAPLSMLTFSPQAGDYEFVLNDSLNNSVIVQGTDSSPHTFTVPANTSVAFPAGCQIYVFQGGTGTITIAGAGGVTLESPASLQTRAQFSTIVLMKTGTDTWVLTGDIA